MTQSMPRRRCFVLAAFSLGRILARYPISPRSAPHPAT
ncbi:hypothetical protein HNQ08_000695 [Deinococcus humi]|uniref:Uncharacterized protein n=1 Tax=Deinococcus humi TaxID=662880 RepID=A0A7W8JR58_9DEIO|nr:hypothetical protein [Deinococcus humi]